jgi:AI-2 transport protein TqsA
VIPVVFAFFLALLVSPIDRWGMRHAPDRLRWLGHVAAMGAILAVLLVFVGSIWLAAEQAAARLPFDGEDVAELMPGPSSEEEGGTSTEASGGTAARTVAGALDHLGARFGSAGTSLLGNLAERAAGFASTILTTAGSILGGAVLVFFLTLLMLIERPRWRKKVLAVTGSGGDRGLDPFAVVAERVRAYLWARTILGALTGVLYALWLWAFGVDLLFVWFVLAFLLNYIPTIGSLIAGGLAAGYAFLTKDFGTASFAAAGILAIEQVIGNYVDPRVQGRQVSISPLIILIALLFWGWVWGVAGAFLAVPMTTAILILSARLAPLRPLALLLSDETDEEGLDEVTTLRE